MSDVRDNVSMVHVFVKKASMDNSVVSMLAVQIVILMDFVKMWPMNINDLFTSKLKHILTNPP